MTEAVAVARGLEAYCDTIDAEVQDTPFDAGNEGRIRVEGTCLR